MSKNKKFLVMAIAFVLVLIASGCTSGVYLLDQPVSDPIMYVDDTQNSDISRCEEGGVAGGSGSCPT
jgi:hypothetical protein